MVPGVDPSLGSGINIHLDGLRSLEDFQPLEYVDPILDMNIVQSLA